MDLYLIRHAAPDYINDTITEKGKKQAEQLADWLSDVSVDAFYHSSMGRAEMTASYLAEKWNLKSLPVDYAREIRWKNIDTEYADNFSPWAVASNIINNEGYYPTGNSWKDNPLSNDEIFIKEYDERCRSIDDLLKEYGYLREGQLYRAVSPSDKNVAIVCHGGVISVWVSYLLNVPFYQYISHIGVGETSVTKIHFCSVKGNCDAARLIYLNSQAHLGIK